MPSYYRYGVAYAARCQAINMVLSAEQLDRAIGPRSRQDLDELKFWANASFDQKITKNNKLTANSNKTNKR